MNPKLSNFNKCAEEFILQTQKIIQEIESICDKVRKHRMDCNISKTTGTSVGVVGMALGITGIALGPVTGGLSFLISAASIGGAGAVINAGVSIGDFFRSREFERKFHSIISERDKTANDLAGLLEELKYLIKKNEFGQKNDCELNVFLSNVKYFTTGAQTVNALGNTIDLIANASKPAVAAKEGILAASKTGALVTGSSKVLPGVFIGVGALATVVDVALLYKDWTSKHPTLKYADDLIKDLNNDILKWKGLVELFNKCEHGRNECVDEFDETTDDDYETADEFHESTSEGSNLDF